MGRAYSRNEVEKERILANDGKARRKQITMKTKTQVDSIEMNLREIGWSGMGWIDMAQDTDHSRALVNMVMNIWVMLGSS